MKVELSEQLVNKIQNWRAYDWKSDDTIKLVSQVQEAVNKQNEINAQELEEHISDIVEGVN